MYFLSVGWRQGDGTSMHPALGRSAKPCYFLRGVSRFSALQPFAAFVLLLSQTAWAQGPGNDKGPDGDGRT